MSDIILPNNWKARPHQSPFMRAMYGGTKRACLVWHRRAGKDSASANFTAVEAHRNIANYWHMLPTAVQGRHVMWDSVNPRTGQRVIDQVFPKEIRAGTNNTEMKIELKCGSTWQVVGSDNYDRLVGANPFGVIFSEWSLADPRAWDFVRPILAENGGWAIFIYTARGKNHGYDLFQMAQGNPKWFCELLTIDDTEREDGSPVISKQDFESEIAAGMDYQLAMQEFYCSFDAGLYGAYYTDQLNKAQFGEFAWNPRKPVHTFWDLGLRDATAIWFGQQNGNYIDVIDYMEDSNVSLTEWCKRVNQMPYNYGLHSAPHDIERRDYSDAVSYRSTAQVNGIDFEVCPNISVREGIDAVKTFLPRCRFNTGGKDSGVAHGVDSLYNYRREYNDKLRVFMDRPVHDWASHGADGMRNMAITWPDVWHDTGSMHFGVRPALSGTSRRIRRPKLKSEVYDDGFGPN
mgnify:CR=1 FL=1